jgi:hypothetical protein
MNLDIDYFTLLNEKTEKTKEFLYLDKKIYTHDGINNQLCDDEMDNFDWKKYVFFYKDLNHVSSKKEAIDHWLEYGKNENRHFFLKKEYEIQLESTFDWIKYKEFYNDLKHISSKKEAIDHWLKHGKKENRQIFRIEKKIHENNLEEESYKNFNWKTYVKNYNDLNYISSKKEAWDHWLKHGKKEKRVLHDLYNVEIENYLKIKENYPIEKNENIVINEKIIFKPFYANYGLHYFGWKGVMNNFIHFIKNCNFKNYIFKDTIFFDEWIEKLLIWGNKIINAEFLTEINNTNNCKIISFIHNPPYQKYYTAGKKEKEELSNNVIFNEELLNRNIFKLLQNNHLIEKNIYLYALSNSHKEYIYNYYPEYRKKIVSVYHPIEMNVNINEKINGKKSFDYVAFKENKKIFHIGWWLRNFKTFVDFYPPIDFSKYILVKKDFEKDWLNMSVNFDLRNIDIIYELSNTDYEKIFRDSCIFLDLEDAVANNVILECIKFNTPIIVKKIDSIVEYLGEDYPLYFSNEEDLNKIVSCTSEEFLDMILYAHEYLVNINKTHLNPETFNKKIFYDLQKLSVSENSFKLTWCCLIEEENIHYIDILIEQFVNQEFLEKIVLNIFINNKITYGESNVSILQILEKYRGKNSNIHFIFIEEKDIDNYLNLCIENTNTDYLTLININDVLTNNFSKVFIKYLDKYPTCDIGFSNFVHQPDNKDKHKEMLYKKNMQIFKSNLNEKNENFENKNIKLVFRKNIKMVLDFSFLKNENIQFIKDCIHHHLNICCVSSKKLFHNLQK